MEKRNINDYYGHLANLTEEIIEKYGREAVAPLIELFEKHEKEKTLEDERLAEFERLALEILNKKEK